MPKTPDEIKKELSDRIPVHFHPGDCEPRLTYLALHDLDEMHADALALIQQIEAQNVELIEALTQLQQKDSLIKRLDQELVDAEQLAKRIYDKLVKAEERLEQFEGACKKWIKVEDQLPKVLTNVLVAVKDGLGIYETTIAFQGRGKWVLRDQAVRGTITHWMPLPEPPPEN